MFYIDSLINQAVNYVANYEYGELAVKVVFKSAKFVVEHGIDLIQWVNQ